ncbi:type VI secretion system Vgr family protein [Dyella sp.]|uniref:type VI secretion system Vgr family protein n=1 Tax=Dyella sp. TaxID=1869338 RepID=UPI002B48FC06|nr:type VI secretion system tip protein TssI/VgrG [Dyella sp.]HKT27293.1 type VI secretion system tip protein TssI/VgrG [Dyella sp.]
MTDTVTITSDKCDDIRFVTMTAKEGLGQLFDFYVQFESQDVGIDLSGLLGSPMTVTLAAEDGFKRYFNGIVIRANQISVESIENLVYATYEVALAPKPWLLRQKVDCRIYKQQSVPDIIKQVLGEIGYSDIKLSLTGSYAARDYCVQYREDYFNFISRLMEQEGIYYYFTHTANTHTMVLADGIGAHQKVDGFSEAAYASSADSVLRRDATVLSWGTLRSVDKTKYALTDYDPMAPKASLLSLGNADGHAAAEADDVLDVFDFPGGHVTAAAGEHYAQVRAEALTAWHSHYSGATGTPSVQIGGLFSLTNYPRQEFNQEYLIVGTDIQLHAPPHGPGGGGGSLSFHCSFNAIESKTPFRSMLVAKKPAIVGLQTAMVTGSDTEEDIAVDKYGRVEVTFHWNTPDKKNAKCSCPVRVATPWAGKNWGAISIPRVGQEVVVSFLEGDPDRPLIIGSVYNGDNTVPYSLPDNKTQSGIKSRSLLGGAADFNELRFEDKKGSEDFFMHAQKDMHEEVENDHVVTIDHDETVTIKNDRHHTINNNDTQDVGKVFKLTAGQEIQLVTGSSSIILKSTGEIQITGINVTITGNSSVKVEGQVQVGIKAGATMDIGAGASLKVHSDAMLDVEGGASTSIKGAMVTASGDAMTQVSGGIIMIG